MKNNFETIDDVICDYIDQNNKSTSIARGHDYWSASSLGKCRRYQVMCRANIRTNGAVNYSWKNSAMDGHAAHTWRQEALQKMGVLVAAEDSITDEKLHYRGHFDMVVNLSGELIVGDIKTQNNRAFRARQRVDLGVDPCHKKQLASYFYFLRRDVFPELSSARLYYVNKNTAEREEIEVSFSEEYLKSVVDELKDLNYHWDNKLLPKKEVSTFCHICQFAPMCKVMKNRRDTPLSDAIQRSL